MPRIMELQIRVNESEIELEALKRMVKMMYPLSGLRANFEVTFGGFVMDVKLERDDGRT